jgi:hypothetical protein
MGQVAAFAVVARAYCDLIDSLGRGGPEGRDLFLRLEVLLADLHAAAVGLPADMQSDEDEVDAGMSHEAWNEIGKRIGRATGDIDIRLVEHFEKLGARDEDVQRAMWPWDDLADIYRDLSDGLALWDRGTDDARAAACWEWRFHYEIHWGQHLLIAGLTVHEALALLHLR